MDDECTSLGDLLGDDGGGVKGRVNSSDPLVLNRFLKTEQVDTLPTKNQAVYNLNLYSINTFVSFTRYSQQIYML